MRTANEQKHDSKQFLNLRSGSGFVSCCFNHEIGLPTKNGQVKGLFETYEYDIYKALMQPSYANYKPLALPYTDTIAEKHQREKGIIQGISNVYSTNKLKHLFIKKATGLGITEFMLRFMAWLCLKDDQCKNSQMVIITGPNIDLAIKLIRRMKGLFAPLGIYFDSKETVLNLNGCEISAYPSNHLDSFRSLTNPKFIFLDEADFAPPGQQDEMRHVAERYIAKSDPYIVMVSTPNRPDGLFARIEKEPFDECIYKRLFLDYTYSLGKIYTEEEIEKAKASPSFPREYQLQYLGLIGNVFSTSAIQRCQEIEYDPEQTVYNAKVSVGIDPGFGSSNFGIVATHFVNGKIQVIVAEEHERDSADFNLMLDRVWQIKRQYGLSAAYVDSANPEIWQSLKKMFQEPHSEAYVSERLAYCKKNNLDPANSMRIVPVPFNSEGKKMLQHTKSLLEDPKQLVLIDKRFDKLLTALRTAVAEEYNLKKDDTSYDDVLDAFRLSLQFYKRGR